MPILKRVLILEDEIGIRDVYELLFSGMPVELIMSETIGQALALLTDQSYDLFISDLRLPDGSGVDAIQACQKKSPATKIIVVTGAASFDQQEQVEMDLQGLPVVNKPFDMDLLLGLIHAALPTLSLG